MDKEKSIYKCSEFKCDNKNKIKSICNEYGLNLGNERKKHIDLFDEALKLKRFKSE